MLDTNLTKDESDTEIPKPKAQDPVEPSGDDLWEIALRLARTEGILDDLPSKDDEEDPLEATSSSFEKLRLQSVRNNFKNFYDAEYKEDVSDVNSKYYRDRRELRELWFWKRLREKASIKSIGLIECQRFITKEYIEKSEVRGERLDLGIKESIKDLAYSISAYIVNEFDPLPGGTKQDPIFAKAPKDVIEQLQGAMSGKIESYKHWLERRHPIWTLIERESDDEYWQQYLDLSEEERILGLTDIIKNKVLTKIDKARARVDLAIASKDPEDWKDMGPFVLKHKDSIVAQAVYEMQEMQLYTDADVEDVRRELDKFLSKITSDEIGITDGSTLRLVTFALFATFVALATVGLGTGVLALAVGVAGDLIDATEIGIKIYDNWDDSDNNYAQVLDSELGLFDEDEFPLLDLALFLVTTDLVSVLKKSGKGIKESLKNKPNPTHKKPSKKRANEAQFTKGDDLEPSRGTAGGKISDKERSIEPEVKPGREALADRLQTYKPEPYEFFGTKEEIKEISEFVVKKKKQLEETIERVKKYNEQKKLKDQLIEKEKRIPELEEKVAEAKAKVNAKKKGAQKTFEKVQKNLDEYKAKIEEHRKKIDESILAKPPSRNLDIKELEKTLKILADLEKALKTLKPAGIGFAIEDWFIQKIYKAIPQISNFPTYDGLLFFDAKFKWLQVKHHVMQINLSEDMTAYLPKVYKNTVDKAIGAMTDTRFSDVVSHVNGLDRPENIFGVPILKYGQPMPNDAFSPLMENEIIVVLVVPKAPSTQLEFDQLGKLQTLLTERMLRDRPEALNVNISIHTVTYEDLGSQILPWYRAREATKLKERAKIRSMFDAE